MVAIETGWDIIMNSRDLFYQLTTIAKYLYVYNTMNQY